MARPTLPNDRTPVLVRLDDEVLYALNRLHIGYKGSRNALLNELLAEAVQARSKT